MRKKQAEWLAFFIKYVNFFEMLNFSLQFNDILDVKVKIS